MQLWLLLVFVAVPVYCNKSTLVLVHGIFRHAERTVEPTAIFPKDPFKDEKYYPFGMGELTNIGKRREYNLGQVFRKRYDEFLGEIYVPDLVDGRSTDMSRTKMSLQLVLSGLFIPNDSALRWDPDLNWQPIPYNYEPFDDDKILSGFITCPNFAKYLKEHEQSGKVQSLFSQYKNTTDYLSEHSGWNVTDFGTASAIYFTLTSEKEWGLLLPEWTNEVYPETLETMSIHNYGIQAGTTELKRIASGHLLEKIVKDTKSKINGSLENRKLFLYSGHEFNIANILITLDIFEPHMPPYAACLLFEVHYIDGQYGFKIFYEENRGQQPTLFKLPECEEFCPLEKFVSLVENYFPKKDSCGRS